MSVARPHSAAVREERFETLDARAGDELLVKARVDDPDVPGVDMLFAVLARDESVAGWISGSVFEAAAVAESESPRRGRERIPTNPGFVAAQVRPHRRCLCRGIGSRQRDLPPAAANGAGRAA